MKRLLYKIDGKFKFCPGIVCNHYSFRTKYPRKCYYEAQCWRGWLDTLITLFQLRLRRRKTKEEKEDA